MTWPKFLLVSTAIDLAINVAFAMGYLLCGPDALVGAAPSQLGGVLPHNIMVFESLTALMSQALIAGLLFARFARPTAAIRFSRQMVVAPFPAPRTRAHDRDALPTRVDDRSPDRRHEPAAAQPLSRQSAFLVRRARRRVLLVVRALGLRHQPRPLGLGDRLQN